MYSKKNNSRIDIDALRHCESIIEDLAAVYNSKEPSENLNYFNLDVSNILNDVKTLSINSETSRYELNSMNGDFFIIIEKTSEEGELLLLKISCLDSDNNLRCALDFSLYPFRSM